MSFKFSAHLTILWNVSEESHIGTYCRRFLPILFSILLQNIHIVLYFADVNGMFVSDSGVFVTDEEMAKLSEVTFRSVFLLIDSNGLSSALDVSSSLIVNDKNLYFVKNLQSL